MNLVIDDAVEVKLATKTEEEKRRSLGSTSSLTQRREVLTIRRPDLTQRRQCFSHSISMIPHFRTGIQTATIQDFAEDFRVYTRAVQLHSSNFKDSLNTDFSVDDTGPWIYWVV